MVEESFLPSGSSTTDTVLSVAQEINESPATTKQPQTTALFILRIAASINDNVSGLHLDTPRQSAGNYIADRRRRFN